MVNEINEVCACGHDDVTHALRLIGGWGSCLASLPGTCVLTGEDGENPDDCTTHEHDDGWECKCPKFVPMPSAAEIKAAQAKAREAEKGDEQL